MKNITKRIKSKDDLTKLINALVLRITENKPISENPMFDGFVIAFLIKNEKFVLSFILNPKNESRILDGTIQQLKIVFNWLNDNEITICEIFDCL